MPATLLFGGTFDPVHAGHVSLAAALLEMISDSSVVLVPCKIPVHRGLPSASAEDRWQMLKLATQSHAGISVDALELQRPGESYTFDTLKTYREKLGPDAPLTFVMGMDSWFTLPTWKNWAMFCDLAHVLVLPRSGGGWCSDGPLELSQWAQVRRVEDVSELARTAAGCVALAPCDEMAVSATQVRQSLASGVVDIPALAPEVLQYIKSKSLYVKK